MKRILTMLVLTLLVSMQSKAQVYSGNPILMGFHADPEVMYSNLTQRYYIYSTTDGVPGWGGWYFTVFSSDDLVHWRYDGMCLNLPRDTRWASGNAWAPAIEEKLIDGKYRYFFYYSGETGHGKAIGVATSDKPEGPFQDFGQPIVDHRPKGVRGGQQIDVDVFTDPDTGKSYLYWGNGGTLDDYAYREGTYVFKRNGLYYFLWSVDDTGAANYHVAYGTSTSPLGPIKVAEEPVILIQDAENKIYGTAHNSVLQRPGTDEWYFVYHRINPAYINKEQGPGFHRQVCIDRMEFNDDGTIRRGKPTQKGVRALK